ncbi:hypothetical protein OTB19_42010 [Streptomyces sp. H27-H5]|nr:hypothetical protein [Streptomyces sp. H27-H5]
MRVLFVLLALMTGVAGALAAYIAGTHVSSAQPITWAASTFIGATGLVLLLGEKTGLIE